MFKVSPGRELGLFPPPAACSPNPSPTKVQFIKPSTVCFESLRFTLE